VARLHDSAVRVSRALVALVLKTARNVDNIETRASGNVKRIERRVKNKLFGPVLGRGGLCRWLWR